jgi:hypothetical protein
MKAYAWIVGFGGEGWHEETSVPVHNRIQRRLPIASYHSLNAPISSHLHLCKAIDGRGPTVSAGKNRMNRNEGDT